ncbi:hypothetical protein SAMN04489842_4156 [Natronobacterium texcoconense]|uniref:Uncharacterized protein n=1 Tax=Natronobacterium texcoconense TaxID=1095778 RepID=A0A1H1J588_NATTX|nr:hypothetical protein SAMN04489842_4156 [Natronobacterium texcoconense]
MPILPVGDRSRRFVGSILSGRNEIGFERQATALEFDVGDANDVPITFGKTTNEER